MKMTNIKLHYLVLAYEKEFKMPNNSIGLDGVAEITIINAKNEKDAIKQAKKILKRPHYRLHKVWQHDTSQENQQKQNQHFLKELLKKI